MVCFREFIATQIPSGTAMLWPRADLRTAYFVLKATAVEERLQVALLPSSDVETDRPGQVFSIVRIVTHWLLLPSGSSDVTPFSLNTVILHLLISALWPSLWKNVGNTEFMWESQGQGRTGGNFQSRQMRGTKKFRDKICARNRKQLKNIYLNSYKMTPWQL